MGLKIVNLVIVNCRLLRGEIDTRKMSRLKGGLLMRHVVFASLALLLAVPTAGQTPKTGKSATPKPTVKPWTAPRTVDDQPDLQGVWLNNSATPLERPKALEGKQFLTDEEVAELRKRASRLFDGSGNSDAAGGDAFFLALLANPERYKNPNATGGDNGFEREFDNRTSLVVDPPDGKIPPLTPEGLERVARRPAPGGGGQRLPAGPEDLSNALRCITYGTPRLGVNAFNGAGALGYYQIVQARGYVVLTLEAIHEARIIPLDGRPHLPGNIRQLNGDSRGRWDGSTLVVDTTNFSPLSNFMGSAERLHLLERFTRVAPDTINYEITVSDPTTWTKPWTTLIRLRRRQEAIYEYACHEGNYVVMKGMLEGARAQEKAAAQSAERQK
jgi:hypothetical protein